MAFESGDANLHAVQRVTSGSRFALTMWFTSRKPTHASEVDETHAAMQKWAMSLANVAEGGSLREVMKSTPPPVVSPAASIPVGSLKKLPSRDEALVSAAICSLPANDPLGRALLMASTTGGNQLVQTIARALDVPSDWIFATPLQGQDALNSVAVVEASSAAKELTAYGQHAALMGGRLAALDALATTLQRATQADRASKQPMDSADEMRHNEALIGSHPTPICDLGQATSHTKLQADDAFSVFD